MNAPKPPAPTPCPKCHVSEATTICRWCGTDKMARIGDAAVTILCAVVLAWLVVL